MASIINRDDFLSIKKYLEIQMQSYQIASHGSRRAYFDLLMILHRRPFIEKAEILECIMGAPEKPIHYFLLCINSNVLTHKNFKFLAIWFLSGAFKVFVVLFSFTQARHFYSSLRRRFVSQFHIKTEVCGIGEF